MESSIKQKALGIIPSPGLILVEREMRDEAVKGGLLVTRRGLEERPTAIVVHPGFHEDLVGPTGTRIVIERQCGHDFWSDALERHLTFIDVDNEVFAQVTHDAEVDHCYI